MYVRSAAAAGAWSAGYVDRYVGRNLDLARRGPGRDSRRLGGDRAAGGSPARQLSSGIEMPWPSPISAVAGAMSQPVSPAPKWAPVMASPMVPTAVRLALS
ncbi:MAG: hypothetical protein ACRDRJ_16050 [Streptosporangiaceae bacterium]